MTRHYLIPAISSGCFLSDICSPFWNESFTFAIPDDFSFVELYAFAVMKDKRTVIGKASRASRREARRDPLACHIHHAGTPSPMVIHV